MRVVKMGGSVASRVEGLLKELEGCGDILIVPGGWIFAEAVRKLDSQRKLPEKAAHWMCIAGMEIYGYYISSFGVGTVNELRKVSGIAVLLPYLILKSSNLPECWEVTSDSVAVWVASRLGINEVVKITDVDGVILNGRLVERIKASELAGRNTCVDGFAPKLMVEEGVNMFVCNGLRPGRVKNYILRSQASLSVQSHAKGTLIEGK